MGASQLWQSGANQMARGVALGLPVQGQQTGGLLKELPTLLRWGWTHSDPTPSQVVWQLVASAEMERSYSANVLFRDQLAVPVSDLDTPSTIRMPMARAAV